MTALYVIILFGGLLLVVGSGLCDVPLRIGGCFVLGVLLVIAGTVGLNRQEQEESARCRDTGGVPVDQKRSPDLCLAPGSIVTPR